MPDGASRKSIDDIYTQSLCGLGSIDYLQGGTLADAFGFAVAPDVRGQDCLVTLINIVAHGLPN